MEQLLRALLIIDMQNDFVLAGSPMVVSGAQQTIPAIKQALQTFRRKQWPVFFIVREHKSDGSDVEITRLSAFQSGQKYCVPGTHGYDIVSELKPEDGENIITKTRFSAFMNTTLDVYLKRHKIDHLVVCGTQYPHCIRSTVYDGISLGYWVTVLTDATSAQSEDIAAANIRDMKDIGVTCIPVDEFLVRHLTQ